MTTTWTLAIDWDWDVSLISPISIPFEHQTQPTLS